MCIYNLYMYMYIYMCTYMYKLIYVNIMYIPKFVEIGPLENVLGVINVRESYEENDAEKQYPDESAEAGNN